MPQKNAFIDSITTALKCWGFVQTNDPGDIVIPVAEDFNLVPGQWQWDGANWKSYTAPVHAPTAAQVALTNFLAIAPTAVTPPTLYIPQLQAILGSPSLGIK